MSDAKSVESVLAHLESNTDAALERLKDFLRIPSVSTDPAYSEHCRAAGQWVIDQLKDIGFTDTRLRSSDTHPVAFGHYPGCFGARSVGDHSDGTFR